MVTDARRWAIALLAVALVAAIIADVDFWGTLPYGSRWLPYGSNVEGRSLGLATACCLFGAFAVPGRAWWFTTCALIAGLLFSTSTFDTGAGEGNEYLGVVLLYFLLVPLTMLIAATLLRVGLDSFGTPSPSAVRGPS